MNVTWEETLDIRAYDVDSNNRLKVSSIFNHMQDVASVHADALELGFKQLSAQGLFWVLSWVKIEIDAYPKFGSSIKVKTWPRCRHKLYSMRDFLLSDERNNIFCRATTAWLLINANSKRPVDVGNLTTPIPYQPNEQALTDVPEKISTERNAEIVFNKRVHYSDVDINQHVNNAKYVEYILDCYGEEHHRKYQLASLIVSFVSETKFGDEIAVRKDISSTTNGLHYIDAVNIQTEKQTFQALVEWKA